MAMFLCRDVENDLPDALLPVKVATDEPKYAAEAFAGRMFDMADPVEVIVVGVRRREDDKEEIFDVTVRCVPEFVARKKSEQAPGPVEASDV